MTAANFIVELPVYVRVRSEGLPAPHLHGQQSTNALLHFIACDKSSAKLLD